MLLRLLDPSCYNDLALLTAVSVIALVIADSRFSHILIRKAAPSDQDYTSVFCFNVGASAVLYFAIVAFAPWIGRYYDQPQFAHAAPIFFLILPLNALGSVQLTQLVRQFRFAQISKITFLASATSGVAAVAMALLSAAMYGGVVLVGDTLQCGAFGALAAKIAAGVAIYTIGSWIFRLEAFKEVCTLINIETKAPKVR